MRASHSCQALCHVATRPSHPVHHFRRTARPECPIRSIDPIPYLRPKVPLGGGRGTVLGSWSGEFGMQRRRGAGVAAGDCVGVFVECGGDALVIEATGDHHDWDAGVEHLGGHEVSEIV